MLIVLLSVTWSPFIQEEILTAIGKGVNNRYENMILTKCMAGQIKC